MCSSKMSTVALSACSLFKPVSTKLQWSCLDEQFYNLSVAFNQYRACEAAAALRTSRNRTWARLCLYLIFNADKVTIQIMNILIRYSWDYKEVLHCCSGWVSVSQGCHLHFSKMHERYYLPRYVPLYFNFILRHEKSLNGLQNCSALL